MADTRCRFSAPRFQICITNRLSTTNMTLAVDERLEVDSVDSFLILRSPDPVRRRRSLRCCWRRCQANRDGWS